MMGDIRAPIIGIVIISYLLSFFIYRTENFKAPIVGRRSWLEPIFLLRYRFLQNASSILAQGYSQVSLPQTGVSCLAREG
jgi:hypothetical protein